MNVWMEKCKVSYLHKEYMRQGKCERNKKFSAIVLPKNNSTNNLVKYVSILQQNNSIYDAIKMWTVAKKKLSLSNTSL